MNEYELSPHRREHDFRNMGKLFATVNAPGEGPRVSGKLDGIIGENGITLEHVEKHGVWRYTGDGSEDGLLLASRAAFDRWFEAPWRRDVYDRMTLRHLARIATDSLGLVPRRYVMTHSFLTEIAWIDGRNFLSETGSRPLTDRIYAGQMSSDLARRLEPFLNRTTLSVPTSGTSPVSGVES